MFHNKWSCGIEGTATDDVELYPFYYSLSIPIG